MQEDPCCLCPYRLFSKAVDADSVSLLAVGELEDPRRMLDQAVTDMREDVTKMRQAAAQVPQSPSLAHFTC